MRFHSTKELYPVPKFKGFIKREVLANAAPLDEVAHELSCENSLAFDGGDLLCYKWVLFGFRVNHRNQVT